MFVCPNGPIIIVIIASFFIIMFYDTESKDDYFYKDDATLSSLMEMKLIKRFIQVTVKYD